MHKGAVKGFFAWGQNPACSGANSNKTREAMTRLDWMVNVNIFDNETGSFWKGPGMKPAEVKTEVFFLPAAVSVEKEGSITNSGRWMQWRYQGPKPLGDSRSDGDIILELGRQLKALYGRGGTFAEPIMKLKWDYDTDGAYDPHKVAKEINGYFLKDVTIKDKTYKKGTLVPSFAFLQADGTTSSGNWLYCNSYTEKGNMAARRSAKDAANGIGLYPEFAWCWPVNRRIIYNRASVDLKGQPWDKDQWVIRWNGAKWEGGRARRRLAAAGRASKSPIPRASIRLSCCPTAMARSLVRAATTVLSPSTTSRWSARWRRTTSTPSGSTPPRRSTAARWTLGPPAIRVSPMWVPPTASANTGRPG